MNEECIHEMEIGESAPDSAVLDDLLEKTRAISAVFRSKKGKNDPRYQKLAKLFSGFWGANVYIVSRDGKILGYSWVVGYSCSIMEELLGSNFMPEAYMAKLNSLQATSESHAKGGACAYLEQPCSYPEKSTLFVPVFNGGERLGSLIIARFGKHFTQSELLLAEILGTVIGVEIFYARSRLSEDRGKERLLVQMAMKSLSYSEIESIKHIIEDLGGPDGVVVASKIADRVGVTRSVIVNALRKLSSAGIIESRSLGMKGTYIRVLSDLFLDELGVLTYTGRTR